MSDRTDKLARLVADRELDLLLVGDLVRPGDSEPDAGADIRWLTGFSGTSGLAIVGDGQPMFITDFRYAERSAEEVDPSFERVIAESQLIPDVAKRLRGRVGFDDGHTSVKTLERLRGEVSDGVELVAAGGLVEGLRRSKDASEIEAMAEAARIADEVYEWLCEQGLAGRSEASVALAAETRMRELGAEGRSFPTIVAAGAGGAVPHHEAGDREIREGELVVIDMGSRYRGYCSDCTRTFAVGDVGAEEREVYELVRRAQQAGLEAIRSGVGGREADAAAREIIAAAGHGDHFGHGLGHGVGLEVHEAPRLGKRSEDTLEAGDVVTSEPGVYIPGRFGVRIEDMVLVGDDGVARNFSTFPKDLRTVG